MSEEILKALMQLFAIIVKQDGGVQENEIEYVKNFLVQELNDESVLEYMALFNSKAAVKKKKKKSGLTSVIDSVRTLSICKRINKKLNQKQKVVALVRLFELINADRQFTEQRMAIINTVADVFNISQEEFENVESFVISDNLEKIDNKDILIINDIEIDNENSKHILTKELDGNIIILKVNSVDLYFLLYTGKENILLNGLPTKNKRIYLLAPGSALKIPKSKPIYYSDVVSNYIKDNNFSELSLNVENLIYRFSDESIGLQEVNFSEKNGHLVGIMGASGAGKSTMLNVLSGITRPSDGKVLINGIDLYENTEELEGVIGYIPQDDLLIEELTVSENLYYSAKQCFGDKSEEEINALVDNVLKSLELFDRKHLKVGSPMNKLISGGQRKRLNIALELIREPSILFVDEPTSGLSSRDSENVMDLLRVLVLKGKLIFTVIHQPSSDIYKMFDKMMILDTGGYMIYYGNPVEAITYFKKIDKQINNEIGECTTCGNVNPELIFNIIDAKILDEFGRYTSKRKILPKKWRGHFQEKIILEKVDDVQEKPVSSLKIPKWFQQFKIFFQRDFFAKLSNKQYLLIGLLEAPILSFMLSFIVYYIDNPNSSEYIFSENENIPPYIFMSVIVSLFIGLTISAEEIFRDRKILKREKFLNLSRSGYLMAKISILFSFSAVQSFMFVLLGNYILEIQGMFWQYWLVLFSVAASSNLIGLNISASFNSAVTIYILIPLAMIPQMVLGGAMFSFEKLNRMVGSIDGVPTIAEFMPSRWAYEALMVNQYKNNEFEKNFFKLEKKESVTDFKQYYYIPELITRINYCTKVLKKNKKIDEKFQKNLLLLSNEIEKEVKKTKRVNFEELYRLNLDSFNLEVAIKTKDYLERLKTYYRRVFKSVHKKKEKIINHLVESQENLYKEKQQDYHNESVEDWVRKVFQKEKIIEYDNRLIQRTNPIYLDPEIDNLFDFRTHFFAPRKYFFGYYYDTLIFNVAIIWLITILLYITLYFEYLKHMIDKIEKNIEILKRKFKK